MLNRRILRIKVFKTLYSSILKGNSSLAEAESQLDMACESTRDLYLFMLGVVSPLTDIASQKIESVRRKFNPTEEERNPNMKFVENLLAKELDNDPDFQKLYKKKKYSWEQYDLVLKKIMNSVYEKDYYKEYMASGEKSLKEDCALFVRIFEEEFVDLPEVEQILEDMSIFWNDDLAYSLTYVCRTLDAMGKGARWSLPVLYQSQMMKGDGVEDDRLFARKLLRSAYAGYERYSKMVADSVPNWDNDRLVSTDVFLIILGLAEAANFPTIPLKVTINEYVEISKYYGTPKSRLFVNGLLDKLIQKLSEDGQIAKSGKGLM